MEFYEVGVYLVIIVVASTCVFGVMWLLMRSMQPKRPKANRRAAPALAAAANSPRRISEESADKVKEKDKKQIPKSKPDKMPKLKELPDSRLLPEGKPAVPEKSTQVKRGFLLEQKEDVQSEWQEDDNSAPSEQKRSVKKAGKQPAAILESQPETGEQGDKEITLPDLPSQDTLAEGEEETDEQKDVLDLMSMFATEEAEDSTTADLAANLFDVDAKNIEKLGSEVAEFLGGMRPK